MITKRRRKHLGLADPNRETYFTKMKREDPEKFKEFCQKAREKRDISKSLRAGQPVGTTMQEWAVIKDSARKISNRIMKQLDIDGALPENPIARKAMQEAIEMLASDINNKDKLATIRTLLDFNLAKPASQQNVTIKTAEDFLDELADEKDAPTA